MSTGWRVRALAVPALLTGATTHRSRTGTIPRRTFSSLKAAGCLALLVASLPAAAVAQRGSLRTLEFIETVFDDGNATAAVRGPADGLQGLDDIVVSPDGRHVYASGSNDNAIAVFGRNIFTGSLTFRSATYQNPPAIDGIKAPQHLAISPDGKHLYVAGGSSNSLGAVAVFSRNAMTGALTFVQVKLDDTGGVIGLAEANAVALSPDGRQVYVAARADDAVVTFDRDATTGVLTFSQALFDGVGGVDGLDAAKDLLVSPDGKHVYVVSGKALPVRTQGDDAIVVFARDTDPISPTFGELTFVEALFDGIAGVDGLHEVAKVAISADGKHVYTAAETDAGGADDDWLAVFARDSGTGRLTFVQKRAPVALANCGLTSLAGIDADVKVARGEAFVYATDPRENAVVEFRRNAATGVLTGGRATCKGASNTGNPLNDERRGGLFAPTALAVTGRHVYVGALSPAAISVFRVQIFKDGFEKPR